MIKTPNKIIFIDNRKKVWYNTFVFDTQNLLCLVRGQVEPIIEEVVW